MVGTAQHRLAFCKSIIDCFYDLDVLSRRPHGRPVLVRSRANRAVERLVGRADFGAEPPEVGKLPIDLSIGPRSHAGSEFAAAGASEHARVQPGDDYVADATLPSYAGK
jgi:hypothetical protein